jgi:hypothetical protein
MPNIAVVQDNSQATFAPITISSIAELQALLANPPEADFAPVVITLKTKVALANFLGAFIAYGTANTYAENGLKAIGLGDFYSGNVRGAVRDYATQIAVASGVTPMPEFDAYLGSVKFMSSRKSQAGAKVVGTDEDLAPGYKPTNFEGGPVADTTPDVDDDYTADEDVVEGTSHVW